MDSGVASAAWVLHASPLGIWSPSLSSVHAFVSLPMDTHSAHLFTVDVEEYFHVSAFERSIRPSTWDRYPSRVEGAVDRLLDMLAEYRSHATFFVLGWVAQRHPALVSRIVAGGHEIASHGYAHRRVTSMSPSEFGQDVRRARDILEQASGQEVVGYRAPSFSIVPGYEWAFDVLIDEGYRYDSSLFPIVRRGYGYSSAPPIAHVIRRAGGTLGEYPLATCRWMGMRLPAAGGGWLRHFPLALTRRAFREHTMPHSPAVFYIHPWEIDPGQPRLPVPAITRLRHYRGLHTTESKVRRLLGEFRFTSIARRAMARPNSPAREFVPAYLPAARLPSVASS